MKKYTTQIIIISDQMVPNVTPIMDEAVRPDNVVLCASKRMSDKAQTLAAFFESKNISSEVFNLGDAYDFDELKERLLELAMRYDSTEQVAINLTGGTKLMTIAAQMVFDSAAIQCFYVVPQEDLILMLNSEDKVRYEIEDKLNLNDYFAIHGYKASSLKRNLNITQSSRQLFEKILKNYSHYSGALGQLNFLAAKAEDSFSLKAKNDINEKAWDLLQLFADQGSISYYDDKKVEFSSKEGRDFCKGFWLEDFTYLALKQVDNEIGLQDFACSVEISSDSGTKNEIDAAFLYNNNLYIIECKTARMNDKGSDVLYKIDTIRGYAGLYTKSIVASFKSLNKYDRRRADDLKIKLVEGKNLNKLAENIINFIKTGK